MQPQPATPDVDAAPGGQCSHYADLKVRTLLRQQPTPDGRWHWSINPYLGCELGCAYCGPRLERKEFTGWRSFERDIGVKTNAVEALLRELSEHGLDGRELELGTTTDPWQPAENHFRLTRSILTALCGVEGITALRANTRSSLVARDTDLFRQLATKGAVRVAMSIATLDEQLSQVIEPRAPLPLRRLAALEALSRAGVEVGLVVSPAVLGLSAQQSGLETLLTRAAHAGARCAELSIAQFASGQRNTLLAHLSVAYPQFAPQLRKLVGHRPRSEETRRVLIEAFEGACRRLGLATTLSEAPPKAAVRSSPSQLPLFDFVTRH